MTRNQVNCTTAKCDHEFTIASLRGDQDMNTALREVGIREGLPLTILYRNSSAIIVRINNLRICLSNPVSDYIVLE